MKRTFYFSVLCGLIICWGLHAGYRDHLKPANDKSSYHNIRNIDFIYMINLDERPEKFQNATLQLQAYGIYPYRFSAVNGWKLGVEDINDLGVKFRRNMLGDFWGTYYESLEPKHEVIHQLGRTYFCHCMSRGAIGIALSHLSVLQDAYDSGYETIWIMEDDIQVIKDPNVLSDLILALDKEVGNDNWDILFTDLDTRNNETGQYVPCHSFARRPDLIPKNQERFAQRKNIGEDFRKIGARYGAYSMIIRKSGVKKLLRYYDRHPIFLPYDMDIFMPDGLELYTVLDEVVATIVGASSDNGAEGYLYAK